MMPATAEAAATAGLAKMISELTGPMRPTKFRFVVETARSPSASTPIWPPRQGPQVGVDTAQPGLDKGLDEALGHGVHIDLLRSRDDDAAYALCHLPALQDIGGLLKIFEPTIGTGTYDHLLNGHTSRLVHRLGIGG